MHTTVLTLLTWNISKCVILRNITNTEIRFSQALFLGKIVKWQPEGKLDSQSNRRSFKYILVSKTTLARSIKNHYENKLTKNIRTNWYLIFTKYLVNILKFTKYLVNSYHQRDVKHYVLTNWYQMTPI